MNLKTRGCRHLARRCYLHTWQTGVIELVQSIPGAAQGLKNLIEATRFLYRCQ